MESNPHGVGLQPILPSGIWSCCSSAYRKQLLLLRRVPFRLSLQLDPLGPFYFTTHKGECFPLLLRYSALLIDAKIAYLIKPHLKPVAVKRICHHNCFAILSPPIYMHFERPTPRVVWSWFGVARGLGL